MIKFKENSFYVKMNFMSTPSKQVALTRLSEVLKTVFIENSKQVGKHKKILLSKVLKILLK